MSHGDLMKIFNLFADRVVRNEEPASKHINVLTHCDDDTLLDKSGKLIKIIKLSGIDFVTKDIQALNQFKFRRNNLFKTISSEFAFYFWDVRRRVNYFPEGLFVDGFAQEVNNKYRKKIEDSQMFHTELYLAIITKQPEGLIQKGFSLLKWLSRSLDKEANKIYLRKRHKELNDLTRKVLSTFSDYHAELLSTYEKNGVKFSAPFEFISRLINFDSFSVPLGIADTSRLLPRKRLFFNNKSGTIEMRSADGAKKFAAILSIKGYSPVTQQGILNELNSL